VPQHLPAGGDPDGLVASPCVRWCRHRGEVLARHAVEDDSRSTSAATRDRLPLLGSRTGRHHRDSYRAAPPRRDSTVAPRGWLGALAPFRGHRRRTTITRISGDAWALAVVSPRRKGEAAPESSHGSTDHDRSRRYSGAKVHGRALIPLKNIESIGVGGAASEISGSLPSSSLNSTAISNRAR
jgi:hypothetical protein